MDNFNEFGKVLYNEDLKKYTSFKTGGKAKILIFPKDDKSLINLLKKCKNENLNYIVLGNCTNVLISDEGYDGIIIMIKDTLNDIRYEDNKIIAGSGIDLFKLSRFAQQNSLKGLEFSYGIPGSVGGAVFMNAGAYGNEMKDVIHSVKIIDEDLNIIDIENKDMKFGYRKSIVQEKNYIVISATFSLESGDKDEIFAKMKDLMKRRVNKQPLDFPSAGSTFRRPEGHFVGKLVDDSGLKGFRHKGAAVSEKHSGFIINYDNATSKDIKETIEIVQKIIYDKFKVELKREVRLIGNF